MQHVLTPYAQPIQPYAWWEDAFKNDELDQLQSWAIEAKQRAVVGGNPTKEELDSVRRSRISWLTKNQDTTWVFERLSHVASALNAQHFRFDLTGFGEALQLTNYDQSEHGMYGWHQDYNTQNGASRKLSLVLQLTDPSEYEGGNLEIITGPKAVSARKQRGLIVAFPSYQLHQVTPVTRGNRQSLVAWISGPAFR